MRYLAYFQAYTNTHDSDIDRLVSLYEEALSVNGVDGIIIGTRPDCVPDILLDRLSDISSSGHFVMIEYGAESSHESTLLTINRCHTWADTADAVERTRQRGLPAGLHLIMGLPGETRDMMLSTVDAVNSLMPDTVKFHQLQVIRGTKLASDLQNGIYSIANFTDPQTYLDLCCEIVSRLHPDIAIERFTSQSPKELLLAPLWGIKNHEFADSLDRMLRNKGISQGNTLRQKN